MKKELGILFLAFLMLSGCGTSSKDEDTSSGSDFDEITVDFFQQCEMELDGWNHTGTVRNVKCNPKVIKGTATEEQQQFIDETYITTSKRENLSNGDKLSYTFNDVDNTLNKLKKNNIVVEKESLETEIKDLKELYLSASEVPKEVITKLDEKMNTFMDENLETIYNEEFWEDEYDINRVKNGYSLAKRVLLVDQEKNDNRLLYIYKVSGSFFRDTSHIVHDPGLQIERDVYVTMYMELFTSDFEKEPIKMSNDIAANLTNEDRNKVDLERKIKDIKRLLVVNDYTVEYIE